MIQPIETHYAGCRFRSRLEARWAVYFDCLGIAWEYESEGYALDEETWYLPDYLLPELRAYGEVKPPGGDFQLALRLARAVQVPVLLLEGTPDWKLYHVAYPEDTPQETALTLDAVDLGMCAYKNRLWWEWGADARAVYSETTYPYTWGDRLRHAIEQARGARFEDKAVRYQPLPERHPYANQ